jgi:hypothetical protein
MRRVLYIIFFVFSLIFTGCSDEEYTCYGMEVLLVHAHKDFYFYPGTSIKSSKKGYVVTGDNGVDFPLQTIEGFDELYKEGTEYRILVAIFSPKELVLDGTDRYKLIMILEENKVSEE